jgi:UDP-N-acetylglucosamine 2-epimerase (non-hydrolysing)
MKIVLVVGARPNFMKVAPLLRAIDKRNASAEGKTIEPLLVHTGQHYDYEMSQIFFEELKLPQPDVHLGIGSGTHAEQTGKIMIELEKMLFAQKPDLVLVVGDVNSTLAAALAAVKLRIPVAHVEAGLRSYDETMPEEINRLLTDHVSEYLFTTSEYDDNNLRKEGIAENKIYRVGNIMVDSLLHCKGMAARRNTLSRLGLEKKGYAVLTLHRPSNVDDERSFSDILTAIGSISHAIPVVLPVHPRTRRNIGTFDLAGICDNSNSRLTLTEPLGYLSFLNLEMNARMVITDSGGVQVETTILGIPCLTVLDHPVWPVTHERGTNILVGSDCQKLKDEAFKILNGKCKRGSIPELWDGKAAERIVDTLTKNSSKRYGKGVVRC